MKFDIKQADREHWTCLSVNFKQAKYMAVVCICHCLKYEGDGFSTSGVPDH